jgi:hypothetical protein
MPSVNDELLDHAIRHQIELQKYSNSVVRKMVAVLNKADPDLFAQLASALERMTPDNFKADRLKSLLASVRAMNAAAYAQIGKELTDELRDFTKFETDYQKMILAQVMPVSFSVAAVSVEQVYAAAIATPFQGTILSDGVANLSAARLRRVEQTIAHGYVQGKTTSQIVQELRGTRAAKYTDGVVQMDRHNLRAVVQTALSHTAKFARDAVYDANEDIIDAVMWSATLDNKTSPVCRIRDHKTWTLKGHKPIGHSLSWHGGPGAAHYCCRSFSVPQLKSFDEILGTTGIDESDFPPGSRASMDGQVAKDTTYNQWLQKQPAARQDEVLGPTRGKLLRDGKLPADAMYARNGDYLTLEELRGKHSEAFRKAGL